MNNFNELELIGIRDHGVPNSERIVIRATTRLELSPYCAFIALRGDGSHGMIPLPDNFLWLGNTIVEEDDWIFIYTGPGKAVRSDIPNTNNGAFSLYWGKEKTIFQDSHLTVGLLKVETVQYPENSPLLAQGAQVKG